MKIKKIPQRMCIVCKEMKDKIELIRVVKQADGTFDLDSSGKKAGRGAYICNCIACVEKCVKTRTLNRSFKENIAQAVYDNLKIMYENLNK